MGESFVQLPFPCKDCLVKAACKSHPEESKEFQNRPILAVPKFEKGKAYTKGIMECWIDLGYILSTKLPLYSYNDGLDSDIETSIPKPYIHILKEISRFLTYMMNSYSWRENTILEYDRDELLKKLKVIEMCVKKKK